MHSSILGYDFAKCGEHDKKDLFSIEQSVEVTNCFVNSSLHVIFKETLVKASNCVKISDLWSFYKYLNSGYKNGRQ